MSKEQAVTNDCLLCVGYMEDMSSCVGAQGMEPQVLNS